MAGIVRPSQFQESTPLFIPAIDTHHNHGAEDQGHDHAHDHTEDNHGHSHGHDDDHHGHSHGEDNHGHSHGEEKKKKGHGHSHGEEKKKGHGHSHGEDNHGHSHGEEKKKKGHGHSHGEEKGHGHSHGEDNHGHSHGHSHGSTKKYYGDDFLNDFELYSESWSWGTYLKEISNDDDAKQISYAVLTLFLYSMIALGYGYGKGITGLLASGFHSLFDTALTLLISLLSILYEKRQRTLEYSYGFLRLEVLGAFATSSFLLFTAFYILVESVEHVLEPEPIEMGYTILISLLGLGINIGVKLLFSTYSVNKLDSDNAKRNTVGSILRSSFLDSLVYIIVFIGAWMVSFDITIGDGLSAVSVALIMAYKSVGLIYKSGVILLQTVPDSLKSFVEDGIRDVSLIDGVLGVTTSKTHVWTSAPGVYVGTINVRINGDADEQMVLRGVQNIFRPYIEHLTVQLEKWNDSIHII